MARRTPNLPAPLARAVRRFEKWRRTRRKRQIPASLWELATKLGGKYGVNRTAAALRLDYYDLRRRVEAAADSGLSGSAASPAFVEVLPRVCSSSKECVVELEDPGGVKMRIHLKCAGASELTALGQLFWRKDA